MARFLAVAAAVLLNAWTLSAQTSPYHVLSYRPVAAEYSKSLDRLILVNGSPNQLHIYDPVTKSDTAVALTLPPTSLALSIDGEYALVGHSLQLSYVKLSTATVEKTLTISITPTALAVASNGYAYVTVANGRLSQVNLATGVEAQGPESSFIFSARRMRISQDNKLFVTDQFQIRRYDVSTGVLGEPLLLPWWSCGGEFALREDGAGAYSECGKALRFAGNAVVYGGTLERESSDPAFPVLTHSSSRKQVAAVGRTNSNEAAENQIRLFDHEYLTEVGRFNLPNFVAGSTSFPGLGRAVFFDRLAGRLTVVAQAPLSSGLLNDFGITTYNLDSASCQVTLSSGQASLPGSAERNSVDMTAAAGCIWTASTAASWITITHNSLGASGSLKYAVDANDTGSSRTGTILIGGVTYSVTQAARVPSTGVHLLPADIVDAKFSKAMDRIVLVTGAPDQLHIVNGTTGQDTAVRLNLAPRSLSVQGGYAAVGHDGWISYVNLNTAAVEKVYRVSIPVDSVVLGRTGYIYAVTRSRNELVNVNVATGSEAVLSVTASQHPFLHPSSEYLYVSGFGNIAKWNVASGPATFLYDKYVGLGSCASGWPSEDGLRFFTGCGTVFRLVENAVQDFEYNGKLSMVSSVVDLVHSTATGKVYAIPGAGYIYDAVADDTEVHIYRYDFLSFESKIPLPGFNVHGAPLTGRGRFVSLSSDSSRIHVILQGWSEGAQGRTATDRYGVYSAKLDTLTPCTFTLSPSSPVTAPPTGGTIVVSVSTGVGCKWSVTTNAYGFTFDKRSGTGPGTITAVVERNDFGTSLTRSISVVGQTLEINQPPLDPQCVYTVSGNSGNAILLPARGGTTVIPINTSATSCSWGAVKLGPLDWLSVSPLAGTGSGNITITATENPSAVNSRSTYVLVAGKSVTVTQAANCRYNVAPDSVHVLPEGGTGTITINATALPCSWTASSSVWWAQLAPPLSGSGIQGTIAYTVLPNWSTQPRTAALSISEGSVTITQAGSTLSANERFVGLIYTSFFGRRPSAEEIAFQVNEGLNRGLSPASLVMNFVNSAEFNGGGRFIAGLYVGLLDRNPEYAGWVFQRTALARRETTQTALVSGFLELRSMRSSSEILQTLIL